MNIIQFLKKRIITCKLPIQLFSLSCILLLGFITASLTYKASVDALEFFHYKDWLNVFYFKFAMVLFSWLVAVATVIQAAPVVWDRLNYGGQWLDNFILKHFFGKKYFLTEAEAKLKATRKLINEINLLFQEISWFLFKDKTTDHANAMKKLDKLAQTKLAKANDDCEKVHSLLAHNQATDNMNQCKQEELECSLNGLIVQLTETCEKITNLQQQFQNSIRSE